jgi:membrane-bound serine protease (ClpP class)
MEALISDPFFSFLFIGGGLLFLFLEVFVPSGGILGLLSVGCAAFGIYGLFHQGRTLVGACAIAGTAAITVAAIRFGLRRLSFSGNMSPDVSTSVDERIENLVGKEGITHTPLRPAGVAIIDGRKVDVVTQGDFVQRDVHVRVIDNAGNRVVVRAVSPARGESNSDGKNTAGT